MKQDYAVLLEHIRAYVLDKMETVDAGHGMEHVNRVVKNAQKINKVEKGAGFLVEAGALLHDITDAKLFDTEVAESELKEFLQGVGLKQQQLDSLFNIINAVSFGSALDGDILLTVEQKVVRDADRLDAMGAIGIARTFHYGGSKNRQIFDSTIPPRNYQSTQEYRSSSAPTINHFYEKLLLLKDRMETSTGKLLAEQRHEYMLGFLKQFYAELDQEDFSTHP